MDEQPKTTPEDLTVNEAGVFRQVIVDALHVHGQETPADLLRRIEPGGYDRMARRITRPWQPPTEQDLNDAACYIACQAAEIERLRAALVASESGGWRPIATAPRDRPIVVYAPEREGLQEIASMCQWHPDGGFCIDELREPTHWMEKPR